MDVELGFNYNLNLFDVKIVEWIDFEEVVFDMMVDYFNWCIIYE